MDISALYIFRSSALHAEIDKIRFGLTNLKESRCSRAISIVKSVGISVNWRAC